MRYQVNIGLNVAGGDNSPEAVDKRAGRISGLFDGVSRGESRYIGPDGAEVVEPVFVAWVDLPEGNVRSFFYALAEVMRQDCIAAWNEDNEVGALIGPKAAEWGAFNPNYFIYC